MKFIKNLCYLIFLIFGNIRIAYSQPFNLNSYFPEIIIRESNNPSPGYFFVATKKFSSDTGSNYIAIFDNFGTPVYFKLISGAAACMSTKLKDHFIINEGNPKKFYIFNNMTHRVDSFKTVGYKLNGHDFDLDHKGHKLLLGSMNRSVDMSTIIQGGDPNATIKDLVVQELDSNNTLLYTWKAWEHYNITDANEASPFVDLTGSSIDYIHANSLTFDSDTSFLLSCRHFDEITKIDRRTGDIIWRLGGKNNQFTFTNDTLRFSHPHTIRKMGNGHILLFDNGNLHKPAITSIVEYNLNELDKTATLVRRIYHKPLIFVDHGGGEQNLTNGNLLVYWGEYSPSFTEYNPDGSVALEMDFSGHSFSNRIAKAAWKNKVFVTNTDTVNFGMWDGYTIRPYLLTLHNNTDSILKITSYSTRTSYFTIEEALPVEIQPNGDRVLTVNYFPSTAQTGYIQDILTLNSEYPEELIAQQVVLYGLKVDNIPPEVYIMPDSTNVPVNTTIDLYFSEPVRKLDNTELNYANVDDLIILRKDNINGVDIPFNANINTEKTHIMLTPLDSLDKGQSYFVAIDAILEDYSNLAILPAQEVFTTVSALSRIELIDKPYFNVFPNPGYGTFTINLKNRKPKTITIYSLTGAMIFREDKIVDSSYRLDLSGQMPGLYMIIIQAQDSHVLGSEKIIVLDE